MVTALSAMSVAVFLMMCLLATVKPHWTLVLIFSFSAYEQLLGSYVELLGRHSWIINVVAGSVSLVALAIAFVSGDRPFRGYFNSNTLLVWCLIIFAIFGYTYSMMPPAALYFIKSGIPYFGLYLFILPCLVQSTDIIKKMTIPMLLVGCILIVLILISPRTIFYGTRMFVDLSYTTGGEKRGNPLAIAEFGGLMVIVASLMKPMNKSILITILRLTSIMLGIAIGFLAATRGQLVFSIFVAILFYPVANKIENTTQFFAKAATVGAVSLLVFFVAKEFLFNTDSAGRFTASDLSDGLTSRMYFATSMLDAYSANPANYLQGLGTGSFNAIVMTENDGYLYPHNLIIEILTHHGLIGFSFLIGIFVVSGKHALGLLKMIHTQFVDRSAVAIVIALAGYYTLISMKQGSFMLVPIPFYMYLIISKLYIRTKLDYQLDGNLYYEGEGDGEYQEYDEEYYDV